MLCGKQGLSLRGHRDDDVDWTEQEEQTAENQGNFVELVRFRAETDDALRRHQERGPRNARYTSKTIQNELITVIDKHIESEIVTDIQKAKFFSIIADELTDVSSKEQCSLCIRYVLNNDVNETFISFVEVERITGKVLATTILQCLESWGLSPSDLRGQCYDGGSNMAGVRSRCRAVVQSQALEAIYVHCAAQRLNLAVVSACKIQEFQNTELYMGERQIL